MKTNQRLGKCVSLDCQTSEVLFARPTNLSRPETFMAQRQRHLALVSAEQFDPFLRDGGSRDTLARLQILERQGFRVSILNFHIDEPFHKFIFDDALADPGAAVVREGSVCQAMYQGLDFYQETLPFLSREQFLTERQPIVRIIMNSIQRQHVDYILTVDQDYYPLLAAWLLGLPGAHVFNTRINVGKFAAHADYVRFLRGRLLLANSRFIQTQISAILGIDSVVWRTPIDLNAYRVRREAGRTKTIGFCSTQGQVKGNEIVAEIVERLPEYSFLVVGSAYDRGTNASPQNLTCWGHIPDMRKFYERIDLLLVPSLCEDAFPRVILEATVNGIPVIANRVGGTPEALGDSGLLIDWDHSREPDMANIAEKYVLAIRRLLADDELYGRYSRKALARAKEFEAEQERQSQEIYDRYLCPAQGPVALESS